LVGEFALYSSMFVPYNEFLPDSLLRGEKKLFVINFYSNVVKKKVKNKH